MRFVSQNPKYVFQARPMRQRALGDGGVQVTQEPLYCPFQSVTDGAVLYQNELQAALLHFSFKGNTQLPDEATPSDPMLRLSVFDTDEHADREMLSAEEKQLIEQRLIQLCLEAPDECLQVMDTPISAPFPAYDDWQGPDPEMLMVKLIEDGFDLAVVLHYERSFGRKRPEIIEALEETIEAQQEHVVQA